MNKLKKTRVDRGLKQGWVAAKLGISQTYLAGIENGRYNATQEILLKLAEIYKVNPNDLV